MNITKEAIEAELIVLQTLKDRYVKVMKKYTEIYDIVRHTLDNSSSVVGISPSPEKLRTDYATYNEYADKDIASLDRVIWILTQLKDLLDSSTESSM